jgi:hypothetical protein
MRTFVAGTHAHLVQRVHVRPALSASVAARHHVVVQLQVGQSLVRSSHGVGVHLRQQVRVLLIHPALSMQKCPNSSPDSINIKNIKIRK